MPTTSTRWDHIKSKNALKAIVTYTVVEKSGTNCKKRTRECAPNVTGEEKKHLPQVLKFISKKG